MAFPCVMLSYPFQVLFSIYSFNKSLIDNCCTNIALPDHIIVMQLNVILPGRKLS